MTAVRLIARPTTLCDHCGATMTPALRYGPTSNPIKVSVCWECGAEDPPLDDCCERTTTPNVPPVWVVVTCRCGAEFETTEARQARGKGVYCSLACRQQFGGWRSRRLAS